MKKNHLRFDFLCEIVIFAQPINHIYMSEKVTYKELRNAVVHVDNSVDVSKTYEIAADVRLQVQLTPKN